MQSFVSMDGFYLKSLVPSYYWSTKVKKEALRAVSGGFLCAQKLEPVKGVEPLIYGLRIGRRAYQ